MTQPQAVPSPPADDDGVAAEVVVAKIAQSGDLGRAMVERAYYAALSEKLAAELVELRQQDPSDKVNPAST